MTRVGNVKIHGQGCPCRQGKMIVRTAHDGGDGTVLHHCPFCGSGAVVGRSDGTTECQSCMTMFTVQVQPQYPMSPQTMNGQDVTPPGMPGNLNDQQDQMGDMDQDPGAGDEMPPGADGEEMPPDDGSEGGFDDDEDEAPEDTAAEGDTDEKPFPPKQSYRTANGAVLTEDQYIRHLAIKNSQNVMETLARLRGQ